MRRLVAICLLSLTTIVPAQAGRLVLQPGEPLDAAAVERLLGEPVAHAAAGERVRLSVRRPSLPLANPYGEPATLTVERVDLQGRGRFAASVHIRLGDAAPMPLAFEGDFAALVPVAVPTTTLAAGTRIEAVHLDVQWLPEDRVRPDWVRDEDELIGLEVRRQLAQGRPIGQNAVGAPHLIRKGDRVTVVYRAGGLTLEAPGRAQADGALDSLIPVRNEATGAVVEGRVANAQTLIMENGR